MRTVECNLMYLELVVSTYRRCLECKSDCSGIEIRRFFHLFVFMITGIKFCVHVAFQFELRRPNQLEVYSPSHLLQKGFVLKWPAVFDFRSWSLGSGPCPPRGPARSLLLK